MGMIQKYKYFDDLILVSRILIIFTNVVNTSVFIVFYLTHLQY